MPTTEAGKRLLEREAMNSRSFALITADAIDAIEAEIRSDPCPYCSPTHQWPCPTIPRCDVTDCGKERTCGWPSPAGYRRTCYEHWEK